MAVRVHWKATGKRGAIADGQRISRDGVLLLVYGPRIRGRANLIESIPLDQILSADDDEGNVEVGLATPN